MVEMAIVLPLIVMLMLGAADLGRAFYLDIEMTGASRAGMREGIQGTASDLGNSVRNEVFDAIDNTQVVWGSTGPAGAYDGCGSAGAACGDPTGCLDNVFTGTRQACFAVRTCTIINGACSSYGVWGSRPSQGSNQALVVRVVYHFLPITPLISSLTGSNGAIDLTSDTYGLELY
jgi:Flp pilus assembly protein TadG